MCQLLNSFKLMGTDEHMGGTGNGQQILTAVKTGKSVNTPVQVNLHAAAFEACPWLQAGKPVKL